MPLATETVTPYVAAARRNFTSFYWLLELEFDGSIYRFSDAPLTISTNPNPPRDTTMYDNGIPRLYFKEGMVVKSGITTDIDFNLWSRAGRVNKAEVEITGHYQLQELDPVFGFSMANAELSLWQPDLYYEDRFICIKGKVINPAWGSKADTFSFQIEDERTSLDDMLPPKVITKELFPNAPEGSLGFPCTIGYGRVKIVCPLICTAGNYKYFLIFGHHMTGIPADIVPYSPAEYGGDGAGGDTVIHLDHNIVVDRAELSRYSFHNGNTRALWNGSEIDYPICYLKHDESVNPISDETDVTLWIKGMPGFYVPDKMNFPEDPVELLFTLYDRFTGYGADKLNIDSFNSAFEKGLYMWKFSSFFNGFGSDRMTTIDTIHKRLLPQLPVFEYYDQGKLALAFIDIWENVGNPMSVVRDVPDPNMHFEYKVNILDQMGKVEEADLDEVYNHFVLKYDLDIDRIAGGWGKTMIVTHGEFGDEKYGFDKDTNYIISERCRTSFYKFGSNGKGVNRPAPTMYLYDIRDVEVDFVNDAFNRTSAHFIAEFLEYFFTFRPKYTTVIGDHTTLHVRPGMFVTYTNEELNWNVKTCLVVGYDVSDGQNKIKLRTWENMLERYQ